MSESNGDRLPNRTKMIKPQVEHANLEKANLLFLVTDSQSTRFLAGGMRLLKLAAIQPTVVSTSGQALSELAKSDEIPVVALNMKRRPAPFHDLIALWKIIRLIQSVRPQLLVAATPKAGLLAMIAGRLMRIPLRVYLLWGLRLETTSGIFRTLLRALERVACRCATDVFAVSQSVRTVGLQLALCDVAKISVIGHGSSHGVNIDRFHYRNGDRHARREELNLDNDAFVVGFVGRLSVDKGICDLQQIWLEFIMKCRHSHLIVIGSIDPTDPPPRSTLRWLRNDGTVSWIGDADSATWYSSFDVLALPSHREGFPNVVLEAAACSIPTCAYRVTGSSDAIVDRSTGTLTAPMNISDFVVALLTYSDNPAIRLQHGQAASQRVDERFTADSVWWGFAGALRERIEEQGRRREAGSA